MPYELPTADQLATRYPAFAAVPPETIDVWITDASTTAVDNSWIEDDYQPAVMAFAAHQMTRLGLGEADEAEQYAQKGVTSVRSGNFSASFDKTRAAAASDGELSSTRYGQDYERLLKRSKGGPRLLTKGSPRSERYQ